MNRLSRIDAAGLGVIAALMLAAPGCLFSPDPKPPEPQPSQYMPRTTISGVLNNLRVAYENRDIERYKELFDLDDFMFVFDPIDVNDPKNPVPENWGWPEEEASTRNMFEDDLVERIELDFVETAPTNPSESDRGDRPFPEGTKKVIVTEVNLLVDVRQDPENLRYVVDGDNAWFFLVQDTTEVQDGLPVWKIFEWRDKTIGTPRPAPVAS